MLVIETPINFLSERSYIFSVLLGDFLGLNWQHQETNRNDVKISLTDSTKELLLPDVFFSMPKPYWLTKASLPSQPLSKWDYSTLIDSSALIIESKIPIIFGDKQPKFNELNGKMRLPIDVFGSAFFMLTRYEEIVDPHYDEHRRFSAKSSLAYKEGFLHRPIIDEYVEILWEAINKLWPNLKRKHREFRQKISCDVDQPFDASVRSYRSLFRRIGGDLFKRRDFMLAFQSICNMKDFKKERNYFGSILAI